MQFEAWQPVKVGILEYKWIFYVDALQLKKIFRTRFAEINSDKSRKVQHFHTL